MKILIIFTLYLISGPGSCITVIGYPEGSVMIYCNHKEGGGINRNLSVQDSGLYQCGENRTWNRKMNLTVKEDPCCLGPRTVSGYLGETVNMSCSYPEAFKRNIKLIYKWTEEDFIEVMDTTETQRGRFSISDDRRSKVLRVRISDVREDDGGVYVCGAEDEMGSFSYNSFFSETQLQVSGETH
ncbi:hypothetical protein MHYP_G00104930 [Metynnis hypsauchen]